MGRHGPLSHFIPWQQREFALTADDRYSMLSGLSHDPLQRDMFTPLQLGARVCVPDPAEITTPGRLASWMAREGITIAHLTPAMGQVLVETVPGSSPPTLGSLRYAFFVGDKTNGRLSNFLAILMLAVVFLAAVTAIPLMIATKAGA